MQFRDFRRPRAGKVLVFVLVTLPAILGIVGLSLDGGLLLSDRRNLQHATDAAATAAAMDLSLNKSAAAATSTAQNYVRTINGFSSAQVTCNMPPLTGSYAGRAGFAEVITIGSYKPRLIQLVGAASQVNVVSRAVAGYETSTAPAAIQILDPSPPALSLAPILGPTPIIGFPAILGGLEILGVGAARVDGAVLVNTKWGGFDEQGRPAGPCAGPPYSISCTPLLPLTRLQARDIRVAGGVDDPRNYSNYDSSKKSPLHANRMQVPDPYKSLPAPSTAADSHNVSATLRGSATVLSIPLVFAPTVLQPGVYEYIEVISGSVIFQPGVYIIRNVSPLTGIGLNIVGGSVTASGVTFYLTNSANYNAANGSPDSADGETRPANPALLTLLPSVLINAALTSSSFSPLQDAGSAFNGMLIYQRRQDFLPIVITHQALLGNASLNGAVYAKWGHVILIGDGTFDLTIASGSARLVPVLGVNISPSRPLPAAKDVMLVE